ncbi:putative pentatricopeptide repeat-containing protein At3g47840 [Triticum aestivum]|uniref:putative pentatricopeptide repeat-containing protein At3g47840 n=1 Tax=Triticum aestivum TaxID=4565 RepID=UPI001D01C54D|nr:putative pentatricopeptide repeat-containing protein At3g47840 [Triticum aestivum]XP_044419285.1 putative pentatricopeptide repeat-containing protein At3g47840 [Triticum aestivum]
MVARFAPRVKPHRLGRSMWAEAAPLRPEPHPPPVFSVLPLQDLNARLKRLVQSGRLLDAQALFDGAPHRDEASYSALLAGHAAAGVVAGAMALFSRIRASSLPAADPFVLSLAFKACAAAVDASHAASLHAFAVSSSAVSSVFVATALADAYAKAGRLALADAYAKAGRLALALRVFDEMPLKNVVSWATLISALARAGRRHDAIRCFAEMRASGMPCDSHAFAAALTACADTGLLSAAVRCTRSAPSSASTPRPTSPTHLPRCTRAAGTSTAHWLRSAAWARETLPRGRL